MSAYPTEVQGLVLSVECCVILVRLKLSRENLKAGKCDVAQQRD